MVTVRKDGFANSGELTVFLCWSRTQVSDLATVQVSMQPFNRNPGRSWRSRARHTMCNRADPYKALDSCRKTLSTVCMRQRLHRRHTDPFNSGVSDN